jgi:hypothetical protein
VTSAADLWEQARGDVAEYKRLLTEAGRLTRRPAADCIHDLAPGSCSVCSGRTGDPPPAPGAPARAPARATPAKYAGRCTGFCDGRIHPGDLIVPDDDSAGWRHEHC